MPSQNQFWKRICSQPLMWDSITTTSWSTLGKVVGFLVPFFIAVWFGVTSETDVFFFAYGFVMLLTGVFASSIESVIVPFIAEIEAKDRKQIGTFVGSVLILSLIALTILSVLFFTIAKPFFSLLTRFSQEEIKLLVLFLLEIVPLILFITLTSVLSGALNAYRIFSLPAVSPAFRAAAAIIIIFLFRSKIGIHAVPLGYVIGEVFRFLILLGLILSKKIFSLKLSLSLNPKIVEFLKTASFQSICLASGGLNSLIDKTMGSWLGQGSITILHYADRLYMIPMNLLTVGFLPVVLSHWSHHHYQEKGKEILLQKVRYIIKLTAWMSLLVFFILLLLHRPLVNLTFARGKFPSSRIPLLQWTFVCYLFGLVPYVVSSTIIQAFLVLKKTSLLMKLGLLSCFLNVILNYGLMKIFGVSGIALSSSITSLIMAVLLFILFNKNYED